MRDILLSRDSRHEQEGVEGRREAAGLRDKNRRLATNREPSVGDFDGKNIRDTRAARTIKPSKLTARNNSQCRRHANSMSQEYPAIRDGRARMCPIIVTFVSLGPNNLSLKWPTSHRRNTHNPIPAAT